MGHVKHLFYQCISIKIQHGLDLVLLRPGGRQINNLWWLCVAIGVYEFSRSLIVDRSLEFNLQWTGSGRYIHHAPPTSSIKTYSHWFFCTSLTSLHHLSTQPSLPLCFHSLLLILDDPLLDLLVAQHFPRTRQPPPMHHHKTIFDTSQPPSRDHPR